VSHALRREQKVYSSPVESLAPEGRPEQRRSFKLSKSRLPALVALLLLTYVVVSFCSQFGKLSVLQNDINSIQQQVQELKEKNASLREELHMVQSDAYVEKNAREKLGLIKPGETRVMPVPPGTQLKRLEPPSTDGAVNH